MRSYPATDIAFSRDCFRCIKGYLAISVLLHHLYQFTGFLSDTRFGYIFTLLGHWAVAVFLYMSGYGLYTSYLEKGRSYIRSFFRKRLLPFYISYLFFVLIYSLYELLTKNPLSASLTFRSLFYGGTVVSFGWYLQLTLILYLLFMLIGFIANSNKTFLLLTGLFVLGFSAAHFVIGSQKNVYEPTVMFLAGMFVSCFKNRVKNIFSMKPLISVIKSLFLFGAFTAASTLMLFKYSDLMRQNLYADLLYLILMVFADLMLVWFVLSFVTLCDRHVPKLVINPVSTFLGTYSLEIYAVQGLVLRFLYTKISNRAIFAAVASVVVIALSIPIHTGLSLIKREISRKAASAVLAEEAPLLNTGINS